MFLSLWTLLSPPFPSQVVVVGLGEVIQPNIFMELGFLGNSLRQMLTIPFKSCSWELCKVPLYLVLNPDTMDRATEKGQIGWSYLQYLKAMMQQYLEQIRNFFKSLRTREQKEYEQEINRRWNPKEKFSHKVHKRTCPT